MTHSRARIASRLAFAIAFLVIAVPALAAEPVRPHGPILKALDDELTAWRKLPDPNPKFTYLYERSRGDLAERLSKTKPEDLEKTLAEWQGHYQTIQSLLISEAARDLSAAPKPVRVGDIELSDRSWFERGRKKTDEEVVRDVLGMFEARLLGVARATAGLSEHPRALGSEESGNALELPVRRILPSRWEQTGVETAPLFLPPLAPEDMQAAGAIE